MTRPRQPSYQGTTVLVTGAAGAIGSNLTRALAAAGASEVVALDDLSQGVRWNVPELENVTFIQGSILDSEAVAEAFSKRPSIVFHLAALFANQNSIDHPVLNLRINGEGTLNLLMCAARSGQPRFVFASTSAVSANASSDASAVSANASSDASADDAPALRCATPYQITKGLGEQYCRFFQGHHGVPTVRARFFNSYGPGELPGRYRNVIPNFFYRAKKGEPLPVMGTGQQTRDWTFVTDISRGLLLCGRCDQAIGRSVNLGTGRETPVADIAHQINMLTGNTAGLVYRPHRRWDKDLRRSAEMQQAARLLGYYPEASISEGLRHTAQWFDEHWDRIQAGAGF